MSKPAMVIGLVGSGIFALACYFIGQTPAQGPEAGRNNPSPPVSSVPEPSTAVTMLGATSCAGARCHGGPAPEPVPKSPWAAKGEATRWQSSYTVWRARDPHVRAYAVLLERKSQEIAKRLWGPAGKKAHEDARCLACHSNPSVAERGDSLARALQAEGVGCEACHGNSSSWIDHHAGWNDGPGHSARYEPAGMSNLANVVDRAARCAGCHVGVPAGHDGVVRDMNHDMIAAGHPRLNFDYATYIRALPPHWTEKDREVSPPRTRPATEISTHWVVGRAVISAASLRLLASRVTAESWPELAEFNCYACHQSLSDRHRPAIGHKPGSLTWNEPALISPLMNLIGTDEVRVSTTQVRTLLHEDRNNRAAIGKAAATAADRWTAIARLWAGNPPSATGMANEFAQFTPHRWDDACHLYYGLLAIDWAHAHSLRDDARLGHLRDSLQFPREVAGKRFNSPKDVEPERLRQQFSELFRTYAR